MRKFWMGSMLALFSAAASGQEEKKSGEQRVAFEKRAFPFEGEVLVERLNVRRLPKADPTSTIVTFVGIGEKVSITGEDGDFFQILPTKGCTAWVFGKNIKREGAVGTAAAGEIPVRSDSRMNAEVLCSLKEGDAVKIISENMGWFKIEAPPGVKYYVGRKYVRAGRELEAKAVPGIFRKESEGSDAEARSKIRDAETMVKEQNALIAEKKLDDVDFAGVVSAFESAAELAKSESVRAEAERGAKRYGELHAIWSSVKAEKIAKDKAVEEGLRKAAEQPPEPKKWSASGYVDSTGSTLWKRPGTHKLMMGGKIVCFLRVKDGDDKMIHRLNDLFDRYVGVDGIVIKNPEGWDGYSVVVINEVVTIEGQR